MQIASNLAELQLTTDSMIAIGVFDGMHKGHQYLIQQLVTEARESGVAAGVMTFNPHPDEIIRGVTGRIYLTTLEERADILASLGVDYLVNYPFTRAVMEMRARDFVTELVQHTRPIALWVGTDFALGYKREGNIQFLQEQGQIYRFSVRALELVKLQGVTINSSAIRGALASGQLATANELLGRPYTVSGIVVDGLKRGRQIGFPTANIAVPEHKTVPANGVYAGWLTLGDERFMGATNIGYNPTFGNQSITVETHILDFDRDIYGKTVTFQFVKRLRPETKFDGVQALIEQLGKDVIATRELLGVQA